MAFRKRNGTDLSIIDRGVVFNEKVDPHGSRHSKNVGRDQNNGNSKESTCSEKGKPKQEISEKEKEETERRANGISGIHRSPIEAYL